MEKKEMREIGEEEFTRIKKSGLCGINSDFIVVEVLDGGVKKYWYVPREKDKEFGEYLQSIAPRYTQKDLDKAREEGRQEVWENIYIKLENLNKKDVSLAEVLGNVELVDNKFKLKTDWFRCADIPTIKTKLNK